jgi:ubiquitin carboxyl-terminal hydrolase 5/13
MSCINQSNIDVPLVVPQTPLSFDRYIAPRGLQPGENPLPDVAEPSAPSLPPLNDTAYAQLQEMGFPANRAEKGLRMTGNSSADAAMQWLFEHMEDPDIDDPYVPVAPGSGPAVDEEAVNNLAGMGFEPGLAKKALIQTVFT